MDWGSIMGAISSAIQSLLSYIWVLFNDFYAYFLGMGQWLYNFSVAIIKGAWGIFGDVYNFLKHVWDNVLKTPILNLWKKLKALHSALLKRLAPILKIIRLIRFYYDRIFKTYIQPILNLLQRLRAVLAIFRLFHLKFAQKLDADILKIEGKITTAFLQVKQWLNYALDWLNIIVEPGHFFHEGMFLASVLRDFDLLASAFRGLTASVDEIAAEADGETRNKILTKDGIRAAYRTAFAGKKTDSQKFIADERKALNQPDWVGA